MSARLCESLLIGGVPQLGVLPAAARLVGIRKNPRLAWVKFTTNTGDDVVPRADDMATFERIDKSMVVQQTTTDHTALPGARGRMPEVADDSTLAGLSRNFSGILKGAETIIFRVVSVSLPH